MYDNVLTEETRKMLIRPLIIGLVFSVIGELLLLVIYGIILFPDGNMMYKVLWPLDFAASGWALPLLVPALICSLPVDIREPEQFC